MNFVLPAAAKGRDDIARAFGHLAGLFSEVPPEGTDPIAFMRQQVARYGKAEPGEDIAGMAVQPVSADGPPCEWLLPEGGEEGPAARLVFLHGGGWAAGSLDSHRALAASLAR